MCANRSSPTWLNMMSVAARGGNARAATGVMHNVGGGAQGEGSSLVSAMFPRRQLPAGGGGGNGGGNVHEGSVQRPASLSVLRRAGCGGGGERPREGEGGAVQRRRRRPRGPATLSVRKGEGAGRGGGRGGGEGGGARCGAGGGGRREEGRAAGSSRGCLAGAGGPSDTWLRSTPGLRTSWFRRSSRLGAVATHL